jgi:hypothetical protein
MVPMSSSVLGELFKLKKCLAIAVLASDNKADPVARFGNDMLELPFAGL